MTHVWVAAMSLLQEMEGLLKVILEDTAAKDLNARQVHVLGELYREDGQNAKNLAIAVALPTNASTWFIDNLIIAGMVERKTNPDDRRAVIISLTKQGEALRLPITNALDELSDWFDEVDWTPRLAVNDRETANA
jgi:DNA-binding MarR family transcriptional regulator